MSEIEKMKRYIDKTNMDITTGSPYQMNINEMFRLSHISAEDATGAIILAFNYGRAKGCRAAKAEARKQTAV